MSRLKTALLLLLMSISFLADAAPEQKVSMDRMYERIHEAFLKDDYAAVNRMAGDYLSRSHLRSNAEDVWYLQALSLFKLNRSQNAREKLRQLENSSITGDRKAQAASSIGDSYYFEGNLGMASAAYTETLRKYPQSDQTPHVLSRLAEIASKTNRGQEAIAFKNRLIREYPGSGEVQIFP